MAQSAFGGQLSWSGSATQNVFSVVGNYPGVGAYNVIVRANNAGIELGGNELNVPQTAFLMGSGVAYSFRIQVVAGTNAENTLYVRNAGGGANTLDYFITPAN